MRARIPAVGMPIEAQRPARVSTAGASSGTRAPHGDAIRLVPWHRPANPGRVVADRALEPAKLGRQDHAVMRSKPAGAASGSGARAHLQAHSFPTVAARRRRSASVGGDVGAAGRAYAASMARVASSEGGLKSM